jgi:hypothetical protein
VKIRRLSLLYELFFSEKRLREGDQRLIDWYLARELKKKKGVKIMLAGAGWKSVLPVRGGSWLDF